MYKDLSQVERVFRSLKSVDLKVRPIRHHLEKRVRAHVFLCMLAYYVEWHMRQALAPILFDDDHKTESMVLGASPWLRRNARPRPEKKLNGVGPNTDSLFHSFCL